MEQLICKGTPAKVSGDMFGAIKALASIADILAEFMVNLFNKREF